MEIKTIKIDNKEYTIKENEDNTLTLTEIDKGKLRPNRDGTYYSINTVGDVGFSCFSADVDKKRWAIGNGFFTQEEAEKEIERRKVIQLLKEFKLQHDTVELDWDNTQQEKWTPYINCTNKIVVARFGLITKSLNDVYFSSEELVCQAIKEIGEKRIYNAFK